MLLCVYGKLVLFFFCLLEKLLWEKSNTAFPGLRGNKSVPILLQAWKGVSENPRKPTWQSAGGSAMRWILLESASLVDTPLLPDMCANCFIPLLCSSVQTSSQVPIASPVSILYGVQNYKVKKKWDGKLFKSLLSTVSTKWTKRQEPTQIYLGQYIQKKRG